MDLNLNEMISSFTRVNMEYQNIFEIKIKKGKKSGKGSTDPGVCGIVFPIKGKAKFTINGVTTLLEPGVILHAGAGNELYKEVIGSSDWKFILLHYKVYGDELTRNYIENLNFSLNMCTDCRSEMDFLLQKLIHLQGDSSYNNFKRKSILYNILELMFFCMKENSADSKEELILHIVSYIQENMDKNISISQLAEIVGMDSKQFHYTFLKYKGMCPKKYLIHSKIKRAKDLLENSNYSISKISTMVGYEDPLHFSKIFKKNTGLSPSNYKEQLEINPWRI